MPVVIFVFWREHITTELIGRFRFNGLDSLTYDIGMVHCKILGINRVWTIPTVGRFFNLNRNKETVQTPLEVTHIDMSMRKNLCLRQQFFSKDVDQLHPVPLLLSADLRLQCLIIQISILVIILTLSIESQARLKKGGGLNIGPTTRLRNEI